jgi:hypothetical protein
MHRCVRSASTTTNVSMRAVSWVPGDTVLRSTSSPEDVTSVNVRKETAWSLHTQQMTRTSLDPAGGRNEPWTCGFRTPPGISPNKYLRVAVPLVVCVPSACRERNRLSRIRAVSRIRDLTGTLYY